MNSKSLPITEFIGYEIDRSIFEPNSEWNTFMRLRSKETRNIFEELFAWSNMIFEKANIPNWFGFALYFKNGMDFFTKPEIAADFRSAISTANVDHRVLFHLTFQQDSLPPNNRFVPLLLKQFEICKNYNASGIILHPPQDIDNMTQVFIENLSNPEIVHKLLNENVILCIKNAQESQAYFQSLGNLLKFREQLAQIYREMGHPLLISKVRFCFDTGHYLLYQQRDAQGNKDWVQNSEQFLKYVQIFRIHANDGTKDQHLLPYSKRLPIESRLPFSFKFYFENCHLIMDWLETALSLREVHERYWVLEISPKFQEGELIQFWERICKQLELKVHKPEPY